MRRSVGTLLAVPLAALVLGGCNRGRESRTVGPTGSSPGPEETQVEEDLSSIDEDLRQLDEDLRNVDEGLDEIESDPSLP
jgi:hypothetical protein